VSILTMILFFFIYFLINYSFTLYELASVRFPLNEHCVHVCVCQIVPSLTYEQKC